MTNQLALTSIGESRHGKLEDFALFLRETGKSEKTILEYTRSIKQYLVYHTEYTEGGSPSAWLKWDASQQQKRLTGYALRAYAEFCREYFPDEEMGFHVPSHLPPATRPDPKPIFSPDGVVRKLSQTAKRKLPHDSYLSLRVCLIVLRELGVRRSEAAGIGWNDINWVDHSVIIHGKGNKNRTLPISRKLCRMFAILRNRSAVSPWIGAKGQVLGSKCLAYLFKTVAKRAGVGTLKCHAFRTTKLTEIGNMPNFNPIIYQAFSGHSDLSTARFYVKPALDRMREMLNMK